ncbi:importin-9 [Parasteatoda tepidariorum]|nr:importin-9 [Parasteatoda tepidariorum]
MASQDVSRTLKDALFETLSSILSPVHDVRINAEQQINVLEVTDEFPVHLTELMLDAQGPLAIRQLASVLLKQYVECHWSPHTDKFRAPETTPEAKAAIRAMLPMGLQESISKLRSSVAYAISAVAQWDWPEDWPELFNILVQSLISENSCAVHGAMRVLKEISNEVSDSQMPQFAPIILPEMLKIFLQDQKYGIRTRGRAVEIFSTCTELIAAMAPYNKSAPKDLLYPILPKFSEALVSALKIPDGQTSDSGLKKDILNALRSLVKYFPKQMVSYLPHILPPLWDSLTQGANIYLQTVVNDSEEADNPVDSDGEVLGFENFVFGIFDFIITLVEGKKYRKCIRDSLADLLYYILLYMQITEEQIKIWNNSPDQFVEDEDEDSFAYSVRISAQDLLLLLGVEFEGETVKSLCAAVTRHIQETNKNANPYWWKVHESCMLAIGSLSEAFSSGMEQNSLPFDLAGFLHSVVVEDLNSSASPFLYGRCLWFASRFPTVMNEELVKRFLEATILGLSPTQLPVVRVSAVRTVAGYCDHLSTTKHVHILLPYLPRIVDGLISMAVQFQSEVLALVLEAIAIVTAIDNNFTAQVENKVSPIAIAVFLKHNSDPVLITIAQDIFTNLCKCPNTIAPLQQRLIPTLVSILQAQPNKVPSGLQAASLDVLYTVVRNSPQPVPAQLISHAFPAAIHCIMHTDDNSILQNGGECLRAFVSVALEQVTSWQDENGVTGLDYIIRVVQLLLDPKTPECASAFIGKLISLLILKAGTIIGEKSESLLRAVLSKMQKSEALSVHQSLIMVFAQLISKQIEPTLEFLSSIPGPTGQSALEFVLDVWCQCFSLFFGAYEKKVSAVSLSLVLQHALKNNDQRILNIQVKGDQIHDSSEGVKTRAKTRQTPEQWTTIPLPVKILKLLLEEYTSSSVLQYGSDEVSSDEGDIDDGCENSGESSSFLESESSSGIVSDYIENSYKNADLEDDPDILNDPLYNIDMTTYLTNYLQQLSQHPCFSMFCAHLQPMELRELQDIREKTS